MIFKIIFLFFISSSAMLYGATNDRLSCKSQKTIQLLKEGINSKKELYNFKSDLKSFLFNGIVVVISEKNKDTGVKITEDYENFKVEFEGNKGYGYAEFKDSEYNVISIKTEKSDYSNEIYHCSARIYFKIIMKMESDKEGREEQELGTFISEKYNKLSYIIDNQSFIKVKISQLPKIDIIFPDVEDMKNMSMKELESKRIFDGKGWGEIKKSKLKTLKRNVSYQAPKTPTPYYSDDLEYEETCSN